VSFVIAIAAVIVSTLTMIIVALQVVQARKANALPATIDLFREYRSAEMEKARQLLAERLPDLDPASGMRGLPDDVSVAAFQMSQYLDNLGVLVAHGLLSPELAAGFLGDSALRMWRVLSPFIVRERELRTPPHYQHYFEHLAVTVQQVDPTRARSKLRTFAGTTPATEHANRP
jgi:hypothetical protein